MAEDALSRIFAALADPTRRAILARLARGAAPVGAIAEPFAMSFAAVSKHLRVLERAGLVTRGREAQYRPARLEAAPLAEADAWIAGYRALWQGEPAEARDVAPAAGGSNGAAAGTDASIADTASERAAGTGPGGDGHGSGQGGHGQGKGTSGHGKGKARSRKGKKAGKETGKKTGKKTGKDKKRTREPDARTGTGGTSAARP